jgi:Na+/melibiose symporter-like transporter
MTRLHGTSALIAGYVLACSAIGWTLAALIVSGVPERQDAKLIATGMTIVSAGILGFLYSVPNGPVWLIAVFSTMQGVGFGTAWTFILRRAIATAASADSERIAAAILTVQRLGFALGAAGVGVIANAVGFAEATTETELAWAATAIFAAVLPFAALGLIAMWRFVRQGSRKRTSR